VIDEHRDFFEEALAIELVTSRGNKTLGEPLLVALLDFGSQRGDSFDGLCEAIEAGTQDVFKGFPFARA